MKKLFGHKPKAGKASSGSRDFAEQSIATPLYQKLATHGNHIQALPVQHTQPDEEPWETPQLPNPRSSSFTSLNPQRSPPPTSPAKVPREQDQFFQTRKTQHPPTTITAPATLSILRALEPPRLDVTSATKSIRSQSEERRTVSENGHVFKDKDSTRERRGFWGREKEKELPPRQELPKAKERTYDRDSERGRELHRGAFPPQDLTSMIAAIVTKNLDAKNLEDQRLIFSVCEKANESEANAKEVVSVLKREFKYGNTSTQMASAKLWATMLRYSTNIVYHSTNRRFLGTLQTLVTSPKTDPMVQQQLLTVISAAAFATRHRSEAGFKGLWKKVKPLESPEEGVPFPNNGSVTFDIPSSSDDIPFVSFQQSSPVPLEPQGRPNVIKKRKSPKNGIIPPDEDIRRLFQECKIGQGNASLLSQALVTSKPEDLKKKDVIMEFYAKCRASQELIFAQIPWASANAERSRVMKDKDQKRTVSATDAMQDASHPSVELTLEERLLAALLAANAELAEVLRQYNDLERVAMERKAEDLSRKETRLDPRLLESYKSSERSFGSAPSSRSPSPRSRSHSPQLPNSAHSYEPTPSEYEFDSSVLSHGLAPPPPAPHGPRLPAVAAMRSRTPSPGTPKLEPYVNGYDNYEPSAYRSYDQPHPGPLEDEERYMPTKPSAKALGKRKLVEPETLSNSPFDEDDVNFSKFQAQTLDIGTEPDIEDENDGRWRHPPIQFVYDAVAERRQLQGQSEGLARVLHD